MPVAHFTHHCCVRHFLMHGGPRQRKPFIVVCSTIAQVLLAYTTVVEVYLWPFNNFAQLAQNLENIH